LWKWTWFEFPESDNESNKNSPNFSFDCTSEESMSDEEMPAITHSVVFKSIGCHKEQRYQDTLALAKRKINDGFTVSVKLQPEPDNPVDTKAIALMCQVHQDKWERFGYIVREALDDVHKAIDHHKILSVSFARVLL